MYPNGETDMQRTARLLAEGKTCPCKRLRETGQGTVVKPQADCPFHGTSSRHWPWS